jgi:hypothetical protein
VILPLRTFEKDPDEQLDYSIDWSEELTEPEQITASTWTVSPSGLDVLTDGFGPTATTIWVKGGAVGVEYTLTNRITTDSLPNRIRERSIRLHVAQA